MTPEEREQGLIAYERARAFEALERRRLPLIYAVFPIVLLLFAVEAWRQDRSLAVAILAAAAAAAALFAIWNWRRLRAQYARNLGLLQELEQRHGANVPWLEVERHLAAMQQLATDLAEENGNVK